MRSALLQLCLELKTYLAMSRKGKKIRLQEGEAAQPA
jgi:hypothetical protein